MRIIFMGTPHFACDVLHALLNEPEHKVVAVYTQPPKQAGRGKQVTTTPVHDVAERHHIPVFTPHTLRDADAQHVFKQLEADIAVVAAYGLILPLPILETCLCINVHASLLPRWRGAAPIQRAILSGDSQTGITIMKMAEGLDSGDMMMQSPVDITSTMTAGQLHDALANEGGKLCVHALKAITAGQMHYIPQPEEGITYAKKIQKSEAEIDWKQTGEQIVRQVRAFNPYPGAYVVHQGEAIKLLEVAYEPCITDRAIGTINKEFSIICQDGIIKPQMLQRPGKKPMTIDAFLRGYRI